MMNAVLKVSLALLVCMMCMSISTCHPEPQKFINRLPPPTKSVFKPAHRFRREVQETLESVDQQDDKLIEEVTDERVLRAVEQSDLPEGSYDQLPGITEETEGGLERAKRAVRVTVIRVVNRRTGRVTYIVVRRRI